jgi:putative endonuclease
MAQHHNTGNLGESMAENYLVSNGYIILHRNWRYAHWEVDIIAVKNGKLHFVEVKTRRTTTFGYPEEDVSRKKIKNLLNAAEEFLLQYPQWKLIQFDIISIIITKGSKPDFLLIEDVYL